jgi:hypothetical protein
MPRYAFWINDIDPRVAELESLPSLGDELELVGAGRHVVGLERPNHDESVDAAFTVEPLTSKG